MLLPGDDLLLFFITELSRGKGGAWFNGRDTQKCALLSLKVVYTDELSWHLIFNIFEVGGWLS